MSLIWIAVLLFLGAALIGMIAVWYYARNVKTRLDAPDAVAGSEPRVLTLSQGQAARLRDLTQEPILLKQAPDGVRVQIDQRPMVPLAAFLGKEVSGALREAAVQVSEHFGATWAVLLEVKPDDSVTVRRLS